MIRRHLIMCGEIQSMVFNRVYNYDLSLQVNTKMYGFYKPWKKLFGDKIEMIRHVFTPSVSMSYAPDFSTSRYGYVGTYTYTDTDGEVRTQTYNPYEGLPYSFSPVVNPRISLSL